MSEDSNKILALKERRELNNQAAWIICDYLNSSPRAITQELIKQVQATTSLTPEIIFYALMCSFCELDIKTNPRHAFIASNYLQPSIHALQIEEYRNNPYYKNINIPEENIGSWAFKTQTYAPYEAFIYKDIQVSENLREVPQVGFFDKEFSFPSVMENEQEWMSIKPNEINTMRSSLSMIEGNVITFGLGMGYFAYMAQLKPNVSSLTIVEKDNEVINLFTQYILPQFEHKEKIHIINSEALSFIENDMRNSHFDWAFADLWHDTADGLPLYLRIKQSEDKITQTHFLYWIEDSLLSALRWKVFDSILSSCTSYAKILDSLKSYKTMYSFLQKGE